MKPQQAFGVAVRVIGLIVVLVSILYLVSALVVCIDPTFRPNLPPAWHYLLDGVVELLVGLYLLRGAALVIRFAFPDDESEPEREADA